MEGCEVIWVIKDDAIGNRFLDEGAAAFFLPHLNSDHTEDTTHKFLQAKVKRQKYVLEQQSEGGTHKTQGIYLITEAHFKILSRMMCFNIVK